jgi:hypothetical protein
MSNFKYLKELFFNENLPYWIIDNIANILDKRDNKISKLSDKLNNIQKVIVMAEKWSEDQSNGLTDSQVCISALKDIRRILKEN